MAAIKIIDKCLCLIRYYTLEICSRNYCCAHSVNSLLKLAVSSLHVWQWVKEMASVESVVTDGNCHIITLKLQLPGVCLCVCVFIYIYIYIYIFIYFVGQVNQSV